MFGPFSEDLDSLRNWMRQKRSEYERYGVRAGPIAAKELFWQGALRFVGKYVWNYGTPVFDHEWDLLVVIDSCRADLMQEVAPAYDFLPETIPTTYSVGSYTAEWMRKNSTKAYYEQMAETVHITGNPHSEAELSGADWLYLGEVWRTHQDSIGAIPPRPITDYALDADRTYDAPIIVHYMQPHQPFRTLAGENELRNIPTKDVWRLLQFGEYSRRDVWEAYRDNLRWVLDDVALLVSNIDRDRILITSDHGNGLGEAGVYGHSQYVPLSPLKEVPLIEMSGGATGSGTDDAYKPTHMLPVGDVGGDTQERLEALGYVT